MDEESKGPDGTDADAKKLIWSIIKTIRLKYLEDMHYHKKD